MYNSWKIYLYFASFQIFLRTADFLPPGRDHVRLPSISPIEQNTTLERTFQGLEGLLDFYQREYKNLIIDGVFGLRVLEGIHFLSTKINIYLLAFCIRSYSHFTMCIACMVHAHMYDWVIFRCNKKSSCR